VAVLVVRAHPRDIDDELAGANDTGKLAVVRELEVDVALFPLVALIPGSRPTVRGDVADMSRLFLVDVGHLKRAGSWNSEKRKNGLLHSSRRSLSRLGRDTPPTWICSYAAMCASSKTPRTFLKW